MLTIILRTTILTAVVLAGCLQVGTLGDIRALGAGKTDRNASAMDSLSPLENGVITTTNRNVQNTSSVWYSLSGNWKMKVQDWKVVLFTQSTCPYCRQFVLVPKASSQKTGSDIFPTSLDGKGDAKSLDALPATPDVMVGYLQSGLPVAASTTLPTNVNTMETWPLLQGAAEIGEFRSRLSEVLRMALDWQSGESILLNAQGQQ